MGAVEVGKFLVDGDSVKVIVEDINSTLRGVLDDLYGPPKVSVNLWFAKESTVYRRFTSGTTAVNPVAGVVRSLCGAPNGGAIAVLDNNTLVSLEGPEGYINARDVTVTGLPAAAVLNGICSSPDGTVYVLSGTKVYTGELSGSDADWTLALTEWADAGFDVGTGGTTIALSVDTGSEPPMPPAVYSITPSGDIWFTGEASNAMIFDHTGAGAGPVTYIAADPINNPDAGFPYVYTSIEGIGIYNLLGGALVALNPYPCTAYSGTVYATTGTKIVQYKDGQATKTVLDDVTASLIAVSLSPTTQP